MADATEAGKRARWRQILPIAIIALVAVTGAFLLRDVLSFETLRENRETLIGWRDQNYLVAALLYLLVYMGVVAFSLPGGSVMTLTGGFLFGLAAGASLTVVAATIGATAIFLAARFGLGDALHKRLREKGGQGLLSRVEKGLRENEVSYLFLMRLVPAIPFFVANLAPAFMGVTLRNFVFTTFLGIIPGTLVYTWIGSGLGAVFARGETPDLGIIFDPVILGPILALCALAVLPIIVKSLRKKEAT